MSGEPDDPYSSRVFWELVVYWFAGSCFLGFVVCMAFALLG